MSSDQTNPRPPEGNSVERPARRTDEPRGPLPRGTPPKFGRYETWRVLGAGAFGRVYLAFDDLMERFVAVKAPKDALPTDKHRAFLREARAISEIHHPHVCPVYDVGIEEDLPFLVMKFVRGGTLADLVEREPPTPVQALKFVGQIAQGLDAVHARGIFHRDLKPANVLYDPHEKTLLLTDFGIARFADATATLSGTPGTPLYMAPEQWGPGDEFGDISARTDIYALGVMLFEFLTGERLFDGPVYSLVRQHCSAPPRKPSEVRSELGARYDALCLKALAKKQSDRYADAKAVVDAVTHMQRAPQQTIWRVLMKGTWYARPANASNVQWHQVTATPAEITTRAGELYSFDASSDVTDTDLIHLETLRGLTALTMLDLKLCAQLTHAGLAHLENLTALTALDLSDTQITDAGLAHLKNHTALTILYLGGTRLTDAGMTHLKSLTALTALYLRDTQVTDAGLAHLKNHTALTILYLGGTQITDAGMVHLKNLTTLTTLELWACARLTDRGLAHLKGLTALTTLHLWGCTQLTGAGFMHLKGLTALTTLNLCWCTQLTDAGLAHLKSLTALTTLDFRGCRQLTDAGLAALRAALPNCQIKH